MKSMLNCLLYEYISIYILFIKSKKKLKCIYDHYTYIFYANNPFAIILLQMDFTIASFCLIHVLVAFYSGALVLFLLKPILIYINSSYIKKETQNEVNGFIIAAWVMLYFLTLIITQIHTRLKTRQSEDTSF